MTCMVPFLMITVGDFSMTIYNFLLILFLVNVELLLVVMRILDRLSGAK